MKKQLVTALTIAAIAVSSIIMGTSMSAMASTIPGEPVDQGGENIGYFGDFTAYNTENGEVYFLQVPGVVSREEVNAYCAANGYINITGTDKASFKARHPDAHYYDSGVFNSPYQIYGYNVRTGMMKPEVRAMLAAGKTIEQIEAETLARLGITPITPVTSTTATSTSSVQTTNDGGTITAETAVQKAYALYVQSGLTSDAAFARVQANLGKIVATPASYEQIVKADLT